MILQTRTSHHKIVSIGVVFFLIILLFYFLRTPLHGLAYYTSSFSPCLFPLYLSHFLSDFTITYTIVYPIHGLQVEQYSALFYRLKLFQSILYTAE